MNDSASYRILVLGDTDWDDASLVISDLKALVARFPHAAMRLYVRQPRGVEKLAEEYAKASGWSVEGCLPEFNAFDKPATAKERGYAIVKAAQPHFVLAYFCQARINNELLCILEAIGHYQKEPRHCLIEMCSRKKAVRPPAPSPAAHAAR
jgi:hypothetical protein